jgi:hypothetical protein
MIEYFFRRTIIKGIYPLIIVLNCHTSVAQVFNHTWLIGYHYQPSSVLERMNFTASSYSLIPEIRKMDFFGTQGNTSDPFGNFLFSSNGEKFIQAMNPPSSSSEGYRCVRETRMRLTPVIEPHTSSSLTHVLDFRRGRGGFSGIYYFLLS